MSDETVATFEEREVVADEMTEAISEWRTNLERKTDLINVSTIFARRSVLQMPSLA